MFRKPNSVVKDLKKTQSTKGEFEKPSYLLQILIDLIDSLGFFKSYCLTPNLVPKNVLTQW